MLRLKNKKITVVGFGKSGQSAARFLVNQGAKVTVTDTKSKFELTEAMRSVEDLKIEFDLGQHSSKTFTAADYIVLSPGVSSKQEQLMEAKASGIPVINDIELLYHFTKTPIIAVTGTNGKTTTVSLIGDMFRNSGKKVFVGGNNGNPALNYLNNNEEAEMIVLEVSSFQLEHTQDFKPAISVITNLEPDHLDRYPEGVEAYYGAKRRLLKNADTESMLVTNLDNGHAAHFADAFPGKVFYFTKRDPMRIDPNLAERFRGAYLKRPNILIKNGREETYSLLGARLAGNHNRENKMAAAMAAHLAGCTQEGIQRTILGFTGVPHRLEYVRRKDGVNFYNDSKATNVSSAHRALDSFQQKIIWIAGGRDKDQDFTPLLNLVKNRVKNLILVGEAKEKINRTLGDHSETFLVGTFEEAILIAYQKSRTGDVVLLSPGCASHDMFGNFEERGDYFKKLVGQL